MARNIQTIAAAGAEPVSGLTSAAALSLFQTNSAYEYISTVRFTSAEVATFEIRDLNTTLYSGFRIESQRLSFGSANGTAQNQWTIRLLLGGSTDSTSSYNSDYLRFGYTPWSGVQSSFTYWGTQMGYYGHPAPCDFVMDLNIDSAVTSGLDANMVMILGGGKVGGYGAQAGVITGIHTYAGANLNGISFNSNGNFRAIGTNAQVNVYGKRVR